MKHLIQFLGVMSLAANCFADHPPHPRNANEFFLAETAGEEMFGYRLGVQPLGGRGRAALHQCAHRRVSRA